MLFYLLAFSVFICFNASSQAPVFNFGTVPMQDMTQKVYLGDSSAEAVVLYEKGAIHFSYDDEGVLGYYMESRVQVRKKILKPSGLQQAVAVIPHMRGNGAYEELLVQIRANIYNLENNRIIKYELDNKDIFKEKVTDKYYQTRIVFPKAKEGSVIEYEYVVQTPLSVRDTPRSWYFQGDIPKVWSELDITIPRHFFYQIIASGYFPLYMNEKKDVDVNMGHAKLKTAGVRYHVAVKDAPAFKDEPYITTKEDYLTKLDFELSQVALPGNAVKTYSTSWQELDKTLLGSENWGGRLKKNNFLEEPAAVFKSTGDKKERLDKAYTFMLSKLKWNGQRGLWVSDDLKKIYDNQTGSASELNMLMLAFLKELGFDAYPVILSTRGHGKIDPEFPLIDKFNYTLVLVELNGEKIFVNVTDPYLKLGSIPQECLNRQARVVRSKNGGMIEIADNDKFKELESFTVKFDIKNNKMLGDYTLFGSGYQARNLRSEYGLKGEEAYRKELAGKYGKLKLKDIRLENFKDLNENPAVSFGFVSEEDLGDPGILYIDPLIFGKIEKNPFVREKREYPIDFNYLTEKTTTGTYIVPEGYEVEGLPETLVLALPEAGGKFTYFCSEKDGKIQVVSKLNINRSVFQARDYDALKDFYSRIVRKHAEQIILKKKN